MANSLCAEWIEKHPEIATAGLQALGIQGSSAGDAGSWIQDVHEKLEESGRDDYLRHLIQALVARFSEHDILIFVSIISYGVDQKHVRKLVDDELSHHSADPKKRQKLIEEQLQASREHVQNLETQKSAAQAELKNTIKQSQERLNQLSGEERTITSEVEEHEGVIDQIKQRLEQAGRELRDRQEVYEGAKRQKNSIAKTLQHAQADLQKLQREGQKRLQQLADAIKKETSSVAELTHALKEIEASAQAEDGEDRSGVVQNLTATGEATSESPSSVPIASGLDTQEIVPQPEKMGINALCYQAIQRTFRNTVVSFLRERFTRLFPSDHALRLRTLFGDEWVKAEHNAKLSRANLGTTTTIRDAYDLLGSNHFFPIFDKYFDKLFSQEAGQPDESPRPVKSRFLGNLKAIKDSRDPLSHPVEEEISPEEAHYLLYGAQEVLKWLGCSAQANDIASLQAQLIRNEPEAKNLLRRIPSQDSIYLEFVGRDNLLKDLSSCFANVDNKRCLLAGDGGKGKSAAAYRFVQTLSGGDQRFQLIVWLSAKKRKFREGAVSMIETPDFATAPEAIDRLLAEYGATADDRARPPQEKRSLLTEYLNEFPSFIVADDIDSVLDDDDVVSLFTHEIPHTRSCVLLTSRRHIPGIRTFVLPGFGPEEAEEFIKSRIRLYGLKPSEFTQGVIRNIMKYTDGSPLYMDDLLRLAKVVDIQMAIRMWGEKGGDEARKYALQREIELLSLDGKRVLIAAAVRDDAVSFAELQAVLDLSDDRLLSALTELQTLFLFPKAPVVEGEQRYQINLNTKKLIRAVEGGNEAYARIEKKAKALSGELPKIEHSIIGSLVRQAMLRLNAQQNTEAEAILLNATERYPGSPDLRGILGFVYKRLGRTSDARTQFEAAFKLKASKPDMYLHWIKLEIGEKEWLKAVAVAERAQKLLQGFDRTETYELLERKVYAMRNAGFDLYQGTHYEKAAKIWGEAVDEIRRSIKGPDQLPSGARSLNASMYYTAVICLDMMNEFRERNHWLERWEKEHPDDPKVQAQKAYLIKKRGRL